MSVIGAVWFCTQEDKLSEERDSQKLCRTYPVCGYLASSLTLGLDRWKRHYPGKIFTSTYEVLLNPEYGVAHARYHTAYGIDIVPAVAAMSGVESELSNAIQRENRLAIALRAAGTEKFPVPVQAVDQWKWIVVDGCVAKDVMQYSGKNLRYDQTRRFLGECAARQETARNTCSGGCITQAKEDLSMSNEYHDPQQQAMAETPLEDR